VPLGAVPVLSWCGEVSLGGIQSSSLGQRYSQSLRIRVFEFECVFWILDLISEFVLL